MHRTYNYNIATVTSYQPMEIKIKLLSHLETKVGCGFTLLSRKFSCIYEVKRKFYLSQVCVLG